MENEMGNCSICNIPMPIPYPWTEETSPVLVCKDCGVEQLVETIVFPVE